MTENPPDKLIDPCNRHLNYLRISITDRCNLSCTYCLPQDSIPRLDHAEILSYEEILRIARVAALLGVTKIRVTGGEPLVRKGVYGFLAELAALPGIEDISLTTNGVLLAENARRILDAGIRRVNVSIDTLKPERYREITGADLFDRVWQGVRLAESLGFHPIKLNVVALQGVNDDELLDLARLSLDAPYHVRFIEYMPIGRSRQTGRPLLLVPEIKKRLGSLGRLVAVAASPKTTARPSATASKAPAAKSASSRRSATTSATAATGLRLTASGQLRPCLLSDRCEDLKGPMRRGVERRGDRRDLPAGGAAQALGPQPGRGRGGERVLPDALHRGIGAPETQARRCAARRFRCGVQTVRLAQRALARLDLGPRAPLSGGSIMGNVSPIERKRQKQSGEGASAGGPISALRGAPLSLRRTNSTPRSAGAGAP